jgi:hypothetical protein
VTPEEHNKTLGILHLVYGGLYALILLLMVAFFIFVANASGERGVDGFFFIVMGLILFFSAAVSLPSFIAGFGLMKRKRWAKLWGLIAGVMAGMSFPLGTALCIYTIWFLYGEAGGRELYAGSPAGQKSKQREALYGAPPAAGWASRYAAGERQHEYAPPPTPPNWRDE